ncbi:MAG: heparan-alpha-glucosaminide N-acetyltransferase domain-containing protein, partial [Pseudomonadota bacterium]
MRSRIGIVDTARGLALLAMAHFHFVFDLEMFGYVEPGTAASFPWKPY